MKQASKIRIAIISIFILFVLAGSLDYPAFWNKGADFLNPKIDITGIRIPYFWNKPFSLGLDLQGGAHLIYEADLSTIAEEEKDNSMQGLRDVIERRINIFGVTEPLVQINKAGDSRRLIVELAGITDVNQAIQMIGETPYLVFAELENKDEADSAKWKFMPTELTGGKLKLARLEFDSTTYEPIVALEFNEEGAKLFEEITERNIEKNVAIFLDGLVLSAPKVQQKISGGNAVITGRFSAKEAKDLVLRLNSGALPVPIRLIAQKTIGATLGTISLEKSLKAALWGFIAVVAFMIIYYRLFGFFAILALGVYAVIVLAIFKLIPVTLTLSGIAGFILSIGMAVDANILVFERIREERAAAKSFGLSLEDGFSRAWSSIKDGNISTLITAFILFWFGTSVVKGFALTLIVGVAVSMFSAIFVTKNLLKIFIGRKIADVKWLWQ